MLHESLTSPRIGAVVGPYSARFQPSRDQTDSWPASSVRGLAGEKRVESERRLVVVRNEPCVERAQAAREIARRKARGDARRRRDFAGVINRGAFLLPVPCRFCGAKVGKQCKQAGAADRSNEYRASHPHRLRVVDLQNLSERPAVREMLRALAAEASE